MKSKILLKLAFLMAFLAPAAAFGQAQPITVTFSFTYTYSTGSTIDSSNDFPACSVTITSSCVTGFNVYNATSGSPVLVGNLPNPTGAAGPESISGDLTVNAISGTNSTVGRTAYIGGNGVAAESVNSAVATFQGPFPAGPPQGFTATVKKK